MEIAVTSEGKVAVVAPRGVIDTRGAMIFERKLAEVVESTSRQVVIDLQKVDLITSAGIRVLVMIGKKLRGTGDLVLCGLTEQVRSVFDIAGLTGFFVIKATVKEAVASLTSERAARSAMVGPSRVSRLTVRLLGSGSEVDLEPASSVSRGERPPSRLTAEVTAVLKDVAKPSRLSTAAQRRLTAPKEDAG